MDIRRHARPLAYNDLLVVIVLIALDVFFPALVEPEGNSSREILDAGRRGLLTNLVRPIPLLVFTSMFMVFAHRRILQPAHDETTVFTLLLKKIEFRFIMYSVLVGVIYVACFWLVYFGIGKWVYFKLSGGAASSFASMNWIMPTIIITTVLATYRFVFFAPAVVMGVDWPLGKVWNLSKSRFFDASDLDCCIRYSRISRQATCGARVRFP